MSPPSSAFGPQRFVSCRCTAFALVFAGSAAAHAAVTAVAQNVFSPTGTSHRADSSTITVRPLPSLRCMLTARLRQPYRLRVAFKLGHTDEQPLPLTLRRLLFITVSGPAGTLDHPAGMLTINRESYGRDCLWPWLQLVLSPPRLFRRYPFRLTATTPNLWIVLFFNVRPRLASRPPQWPT